jgi:hypothetical protein
MLTKFLVAQQENGDAAIADPLTNSPEAVTHNLAVPDPLSPMITVLLNPAVPDRAAPAPIITLHTPVDTEQPVLHPIKIFLRPVVRFEPTHVPMAIL